MIRHSSQLVLGQQKTPIKAIIEECFSLKHNDSQSVLSQRILWILKF